MKFSKRMMKTTAISLAALTVLSSPFIQSVSAKAKDNATKGKAAKNVILFVGDGMGTAHRDAIRLATVGTNGELAMNDMSVTGLVRTGASSSFVTDSAAAATAMASGVKTYNGAVGVDVNQNPVGTVLELAKKEGKSTGLVTTSQVTDATPAAFGAHVTDRSKQSDIAKQFLDNSKVDVILGGGEDYWFPAGNAGAYPDNPPEDAMEASKGTQGNLVEEAQKRGYSYVKNAEELKKTTSNKILGLFANEEMFQQKPEGEGDIYNPVVSLPEMTQKALDTLSQNKEGFFLMVEEEGIDEMAHQNNGALTIKAGQQLDKSVEIAKAYAKSHPDTLILVAADHETGGLSLESEDAKDESGDGISKEDGAFQIANSNEKFYMDWTTSGHTSADTPLTAMGRGAELFSGFYENTHIHDAIIQAMKLK